ncbi:hypothetical protein NHQ30_009858 [Ciborinia camelliae]|nr:hypothetical protein NHQ30_009858 [Ciborinia camelliae]
MTSFPKTDHYRTEGKGNGNGNERDKWMSSPSISGGGDKGGVGRVGGGGNKGPEGSRLGKLEEMGTEKGMSVPGDASPHDQMVWMKMEEEKRLRKEEEEAEKLQREKEEEEEKAKEEENENEADEDEDTKESADEEEEENEDEGGDNEEEENDIETELGEVDGPPSLQSFCESITFQPGLYLQCHSWVGPNSTSISGGLNNARNRIQTCLRLALDLGSGIIIPTIQTQRHAEAPSTYSDEAVCADVYFDIDFLLQEMGSACPGLEMRRCGDVSGIDQERITQMERRDYHDDNYHIGKFKSTVTEHLESLSLSSFSAENPLVVGFGDTMNSFNYTYDSDQALQKQLFRTLKYNRKLLDLGSQLLDTPELRDGYIGIHFRGESDWPPIFGSREEQMDFFAPEIELASADQGAAEGIKTIYISCGDETAIEKFREPLSALGYQVYDKWALVSSLPDLSSQLKEMEFDTMAIIDYAVLVEAKFFLGVWMSTFSQTISYARTAEDEDDFWETYITPGSRRDGLARVWDNVPALKGDETTKLLVVNTGDISNMDSYP